MPFLACFEVLFAAFGLSGLGLLLATSQLQEACGESDAEVTVASVTKILRPRGLVNS